MPFLTIPAKANRVISSGFSVHDWTISDGGTVADRRCMFPWSQLSTHGYNGGYYISFSEDAPYTPASAQQWFARSPYATLTSFTAFTPEQIAQLSHTMPSVAGAPASVSGTLSYPDDESFYGAFWRVHAVPSPGYYYDATVILIETAVAEISRVGREFNLSAISYQLTEHADLALAPEYFEWDFNGTRVFVEGTTPEVGWDSYIPYRADAITHTFEGNAHGPVRVRSKNQYGQVSRWCIVPFAPVASAVATQDGDTLEINASDSFDPDGTVSEYQFVIGYAKPEDQPEEYFWGAYEYEGENDFYRLSAHPVVTADISSLTGFDDGDQVPVTMRVKDSDGYWSDSHIIYFTYESGLILGSFIDKSGVLFTAVNDGDNVRVSKFPAGTASRELLALIENAKNPSLFKIGGTIHLAYTDRSDGCCKICFSLDGANTFSMPVTIWDNTYQNGTVSPTLDGAISGAAKKSTSPVQYEFKRTVNLQNWAVTPAPIGTAASGKVIHVHQKAVAGKSTLIATNGVQIWISHQMGKPGSWQPY